jgi:hypothetical protein
MGEQVPMDTLREFVRAAWETDFEITNNGLPNPTEVWSKPDIKTGSLELRRITTRETIATKQFKKGIRSDFYELYWADLSGGSTLSQVKDWFVSLLFRNPFTQVPRAVFSAWILLWALTLLVLVSLVATSLPRNAMVWGVRLWDFPPLLWLTNWQAWLLVLLVVCFGAILGRFIVPYFGRVVRYTHARPVNIAARENIRKRGLALLSDLHQGDYDRIIIVGHSLGSILAYDLISYFWASRTASRTVVEKTPEFVALQRLERILRDAGPAPTKEALSKFDSARRDLCRALRLRKKGPSPTLDGRWLITDLITLGSPLGHAEFLLANSAADLKKRQLDRELPLAPPLREVLDPQIIAKAKRAGFPLDGDNSRLLCFPFGSKGQWQLHHAAPFAAVRWTNIYDPARMIFFGDVVSSPAALSFGPAINDVDLRRLRGQSWRFSHTRYWFLTRQVTKPPPHISVLRQALDLAGKQIF